MTPPVQAAGISLSELQSFLILGTALATVLYPSLAFHLSKLFFPRKSGEEMERRLRELELKMAKLHDTKTKGDKQ